MKFNGNKNLNKSFNKHENEIKILNEKLSNLENHIKDIIKSNSFQIKIKEIFELPILFFLNIINIYK